MAHNDPPLDLTDELLHALVDGELDTAMAARIEAQLALDERAAAFVRRERALRRRLSAAYDPVAAEPVPDRLLASLGLAGRAANDPGSGAPVVGIEAARLGREPWRWNAWRAWIAMAASLALGTFIGQRIVSPDAAPAVAAADGAWVASAALAQALDTQGAATQGPQAPVRMAVSFLARDGRYCRSFMLARDAMAGLACRQGERWRIELLAQAEPAAGTHFRQAASGLPAAVLQAMDARIAGAPLDAAAEQQALQRGWRPAP